MKARRWNKLNAALWEFVRGPLMDEIDQSAWYDTLKKSQIKKRGDMQTVRCYTLNYSYMHFDALIKLINEQLKPRLKPLRGRLLHIALGCGPGTDSWAVVRALGKSVNVTTIGYDHNRNMIELARNIAERITKNESHKYEYFDDRDDFEERSVDSKGRVALVTINALFGQETVTDEFVTWIADLIDWLAERKAQVFVIGTHPEYSEEKVNEAWEQITELQGARTIYEDRLDVRTWSATRYGEYHWSEEEPWQLGRFKPQSARIIQVRR
jgi:SAM-dependent methyltransferase